MIVRKSTREIELMRMAGKITADALRLAREIARENITTEYLNTELEKYIISRGGIPVFKGYRGFPKSICTSINEEVVHGIPGPRILKSGDILSIDVGVGYRKYIADAALTIPIGEVSAETKRLIDVCEKSLDLAINVIRSNEGQMLRKVKVDDVGDTSLLPGQIVDKFKFKEENKKIIEKGGKPATAKPLLSGITKASLQSDSFISAASFQETTKVLTRAALEGKTDGLVGLKENVILGHLVPAGTGYKSYCSLYAMPTGEFAQKGMDKLEDRELVTSN